MSGAGASSSAVGYSQRNDQDGGSSEDGEHFTYVLTAIDKMDEDLELMRAPDDRDLFQKKLTICEDLAKELGTEDKEEAKLLLRCYREITAEERLRLLVPGRR